MPFLADLHYVEHISSITNRPPLILLHGAGGFYLSWPPQIRRIAGSHVYALDLPGHGQSAGTGRLTVEEYAEDVAKFLRALGLPGAVLAGYSMGSAVALLLVLEHLEHIGGLILMGGGGRLRVSPAILEGLSQPDTFLSTVKLINDYSFDRSASPRLKELSTQRMAGTQPTVLYNDFLASNGFDVMHRLGKISVRTLIVCGAHDRMTPLQNSEALHHGIADSRLEVVENAGHMAILEKPDVITDLVSGFLDEFHRRSNCLS